jgi:hypothetical protein
VFLIAAACREKTPASDPVMTRAEVLSEAIRWRAYLGLTPTVLVERCALFRVLDLDSLPASFPDNEVKKLLGGLSSRSCATEDSTYQAGNRSWVVLRAKEVRIKGRDAVAVFQLEWLGGTYLQHYLATTTVVDGRHRWFVHEVRLDNFGHY